MKAIKRTTKEKKQEVDKDLERNHHFENKAANRKA